MRLILLPFKLLALPIALCLWLIKWVGIFLTSMSAGIFNIIAVCLFMIALICLAFGEATFAEALPLWILSFCVFVIPHLCIWCLSCVVRLSDRLTDFIRS